MPSKDLLRQELTKLSIAYPAAKRGAEEVEVLADMWAEDLEGVTDRELQDAIRHTRKASPYFPTSAEILRHVEEARRQPPEHSGTQALPQTPGRLTEEERERNKKRAREIREKVAQSSRMQ